MAKLDQSFIKAYGHVGVRASGAQRPAAARNPPPAAANDLPLISAAPVVVDAGSFAIDVACGGFGESSSAPSSATARHRVEPAPDPRKSSAPQPHIRAVEQQDPVVPPSEAPAPARKSRRAPAKRQANAAEVSKSVVDFTTAFHADSFTVDTAAAEQQPPPKPVAAPKPVETRRQAPRSSARDFCHRACTVEFSTVADAANVADPMVDEVDDDYEVDEIEYVDDIAIPAAAAAAIHPPHHAASAPHRAASAPHRAASAPHHAASAPRIDGVAYHRIESAPAAVASLRSGYEVDAFRWPEVVNGLSDRATTALSTLIDELVDSSSIDRGVVMFAGERRGAGVTTLAAYAARRMAQLGLSVALVDTDFAKPALARTLGVAVDYGWDDALEANADFTAAMIASLDDGVTILPLRHATFGLTAARATRVAADLAVLRKHFALVILDGGPLAEVAEPWLALAPEETVDCGIVVRDVRIDAAGRRPNRPHTPRSAALPAIGVVENFVSQPPT